MFFWFFIKHLNIKKFYEGSRIRKYTMNLGFHDRQQLSVELNKGIVKTANSSILVYLQETSHKQSYSQNVLIVDSVSNNLSN